MMRRDPEAVAAYRRILAEQGVNTDTMSDEQVIETVDRSMASLFDVGRKVAAWLESMRPAMLRTAKAMTDLRVKVGGAQLAHEAALDLQLRDEVGLDVRLLEVFDDERTARP